MKKIICILLIIAIFKVERSAAQGCVAIRSTGGAACMMANHASDSLTKWSVNLNYRYFKSYKHFVGKEEQKIREEQGSEVINYSTTVDFFVQYNINRRWSIGFDLPIISNTRSSLYEHDGKTRHTTQAFGLGDVRLTAYRWMVDPAAHRKWNVQLGLGIKLPNGDYKYQDHFYKTDTTQVLGPVDQSIQLGDGGTGFTTEINAFYNVAYHLQAYGNFYYLFNPREQNGTSTARGGTPSASSIAYGSDVMSVPDQMMVRGGAGYTFHRLYLSAGIRYEVLPVYDLIGGSEGFRRPGRVTSIEPGLNYSFKRITAYAYVPFAISRNRTQSVPDKNRTEITGQYAHGDAAFADYVINVGLAVRF